MTRPVRACDADVAPIGSLLVARKQVPARAGRQGGTAEPAAAARRLDDAMAVSVGLYRSTWASRH